MTKRVSLLVCCLAVASLAMAQAAFVNEDRVAVFYPKDYDARQHQPSPVFVHEPVAVNPLPHDWRFGSANGCAVIPCPVAVFTT